MHKKRDFEQWSDFILRLYPEMAGKDKDGNSIMPRTVTFQVTDRCNLCCTYCYQINKGTRKMSFETAKRMVDDLLEDKTPYCNRENSPGIIIEFIGGEPFLEIELMDQIVEYFKMRSIEMMHPWAEKFCISISSNGTLYFEPKVQEFLNKNIKHLSISVTIDGNKELHDKCRIFPDGSGSYDLAYAAAQDWMNRGGQMGSKITICPENLPYLNEAISYFVNTGYDTIFANTVYEEGWMPEHATQFYWQLKNLADYLLENNLEYKIDLSLFDEEAFCPMTEDDNENWCGGTGMMLALDPDGYYYPCIRYMESSLGDDQPPIRIGDIENGIGLTEEYANTIKCLNCITRRSQSTDECFYCPIAKGCAWCSGYNYQVTGTPNQRVTYMCEMHKARALANTYYWNKVYEKHKENKYFILHCPEEWAIPIIGEDEYHYLLNLGGKNNESTNE